MKGEVWGTEAANRLPGCDSPEASAAGLIGLRSAFMPFE